MRTLPRRALNPALLSVLLLATGLSGCLQEEQPPVPIWKPSVQRGYPDLPNDTWADVPGTAELFRVTNWMEFWPAGATGWMPVQPQCNHILLWGLFGEGTERAEMALNKRHAIHPALPGPLTAIWLNTMRGGQNCQEQGFFGINEEPMDRYFSYMSRDLPNGTKSDVLRVDARFTRDDSTPPRHTLLLNGHEVRPGMAGWVVWQVEDPTNAGDFYRVRSQVENLGDFPLANVNRFR